MTSGFALVTTTLASADSAKDLARALVAGRLAACAQITQIESVYRWNGAVEETAEWAVVLKINAADYADVEEAILANHPYETPEIVMTAITDGYRPYLDWLGDATAPDEAEHGAATP